MDYIKRIQIDVSQEGTYDPTTDSIISADNLLRRSLRKNRLYRNEFLFTVIDGSLLDEFLFKGTYRDDDIIYAFTKEELIFNNQESHSEHVNDLDTLFASYDNPVLAVYKSSQFIPSDIEFEYKFRNTNKKLEALEAIVRVTW